MSSQLQNRRKAALELLGLLSSPDQQLSYERDASIADVPAELLCMWFDDFYDAKRAELDAVFSPAEREALARFHNAYSERVDRLPSSNGAIRTWLDNTVWQEVMREARCALDQLTPP